MIYLAWTLPALVVVGVIASGRLGTLVASLLGLSAAFLVALTTAPIDFSLSNACLAIARGAWIGWTVVPYILGGLLFWQMAVRPANAAVPIESGVLDARAKRRLLFTACFLIGPFAESATGFGVGIIGTMTLVRRLGVMPIYLLAFSLLSQTMILWDGQWRDRGRGVRPHRPDYSSVSYEPVCRRLQRALVAALLALGR